MVQQLIGGALQVSVNPNAGEQDPPESTRTVPTAADLDPSQGSLEQILRGRAGVTQGGGNAGGAADPPVEGEPTLLAGKYSTPEELEQAYLALQSRLGAGGQQDPHQDPHHDPNQNPHGSAELPEVLQPFVDAYAQAGALTQEHYDQLDQLGYPKPLVDAYIEGREAVARTADSELEAQAFQLVGGAEQYQAMAQWAMTGLTAQEQNQFNAEVDSGDPARVTLAIQGLYARYQVANPPRPQRLVTARSKAPVGVVPFRSSAEVVDAMKDRRYKVDEAYRTEVARRLQVSNVL